MTSTLYTHINDQLYTIIRNVYENESRELFNKRSLDSFDAVVGETACQIRAVKIAELFDKYHVSGFDALNDSDKEFLILSRVLTHTKNIVRDKGGEIIVQKLDPKAISTEYSTQILRKVIVYAQKRLAQLSIEFLQHISEKLQNPEAIRAMNYVLIDDELHHQRKNCASYAGMVVLIQHIIKNNMTILLKIYDAEKNLMDKPLLLFYQGKKGNLTQITAEDAHSNDNAIVVIEGCSAIKSKNAEELLQKLSSLNVYDVILSFFAHHNQFVGQHKNADLPYQELNLPQLEAQKKLHEEFALTHGCWRENKSLLFLTHIYTSHISSIERHAQVHLTQETFSYIPVTNLTRNYA